VAVAVAVNLDTGAGIMAGIGGAVEVTGAVAFTGQGTSIAKTSGRASWRAVAGPITGPPRKPVALRGGAVNLDTGAGIMAITGAVAVYLDTVDTGRASWRSPGPWL